MPHSTCLQVSWWPATYWSIDRKRLKYADFHDLGYCQWQCKKKHVWVYCSNWPNVQSNSLIHNTLWKCQESISLIFELTDWLPAWRLIGNILRHILIDGGNVRIEPTYLTPVMFPLYNWLVTVEEAWSWKANFIRFRGRTPYLEIFLILFHFFLQFCLFASNLQIQFFCRWKYADGC